MLILPATALVYVPLIIHRFSGGWPFGAADGSASQWLLAVILAVPALSLAAITMRLIVPEGDGTPAPWAPPLKFVAAVLIGFQALWAAYGHLTY